MIDDLPSWSPNSRKIAYQSFRGDWLIFVMNRDGTTQRPRTEVGERSQNPDWQPIPWRTAWLHRERAGADTLRPFSRLVLL